MISNELAEETALEYLQEHYHPQVEILRMAEHEWGWLVFYNVRNPTGGFQASMANYPIIIDSEDGAVSRTGYSLKEEVYVRLYEKYRKYIRADKTDMPSVCRALLKRQITLD